MPRPINPDHDNVQDKDIKDNVQDLDIKALMPVDSLKTYQGIDASR